MSILAKKNSGSAAKSLLAFAGEGGLPEFSSVKFCNRCGHSMQDRRSFIVEFWRADQTVYFCWCHACGYRWELAEVTKITTTELEDRGQDLW